MKKKDEQHKKAVKIRKMTDEQLCYFVDGLYAQGYGDCYRAQRRAEPPEQETRRDA